MKRIDVLKGIEQILVQKAYETGHISHRADGDWQKQADGSWKPYKGQSVRSIPQAQKPIENTEYGEITEEDLNNTPTSLNSLGDDKDIFSEEAYAQDEEDRENMSAQDVIEHIVAENEDYDADIKNIEFRKDDDGEFVPNDDDYYAVVDKIWEDLGLGDSYTEEDWEDEDSEANTVYSYLTDTVIDRAYELHNNVQKEEDRENMSNQDDSNDWEEEDTEGYYGNSGGLRSTIYEGAYDTQISNIGNTEEDDYGNSIPNDEAVENVVRGIMQEWTGDTDDEDAVEAVHDGLKDAVLDRWSSIYVQKSAVRDMRSTPTTKNMGF